jgi:hypothetical protein
MHPLPRHGQHARLDEDLGSLTSDEHAGMLMSIFGTYTLSESQNSSYFLLRVCVFVLFSTSQ